jgi:hypothetical protein
MLITAAASFTFGCGVIEVPVELALVGENTIDINAGGLLLGTTLQGGTSTLMSVDMATLFSPGGIPAGIEVTDLLIAGRSMRVLGVPSGPICIYQNPDEPGGGSAVIRPFHHEADFVFEMSTIVEMTQINLPPLPYAAVIEEEGVPMTLSDMLAIFLGGGGGGLEISTQIVTIIDPSVPLFGGAEITANLTLATVDEQPVTERLTFCKEYLAAL